MLRRNKLLISVDRWPLVPEYGFATRTRLLNDPSLATGEDDIPYSEPDDARRLRAGFLR